MATALHSARTRFFDKCGKPLCGGTVHTYQVGTTTAKPTYTDVNKTAVNTNPVILDSIGSAAIFLDGAYRVRVLDRNGVLVEDIQFIESWISASEKYALNQSIQSINETLDSHIANTNNPHQVTKEQVGLGSVDNTADVDKPLSDAAINALSEKSDKADTYTKNETDNRIVAVSSTTYAGHKGYVTLAAAQAAQSTLAANTLVEVTNDSDSAKNGVYLYNGTDFIKSSVDYVIKSEVKDIIGIKSGVNIADLNKFTDNKYYNYKNGALYDNAGYVALGLYDVESNAVYRVPSWYNQQYAFFDINKNFVSGQPNPNADKKILVPSNAAYIGLSVPKSQKSAFMFAKLAEYPSSFEPFYTTLESLKLQSSQIVGLDDVINSAANYNEIFVSADLNDTDTLVKFKGKNAIQQAIDSITDASATNRYKIIAKAGLYKITQADEFIGLPGYPAMICMQDFIDVAGQGIDNTIIWAELPYDDAQVGASIDGNTYDRIRYQTVYNYAAATMQDLTLVAVNLRYVVHQDSELGKNKSRNYKNVAALFKGNKGVLNAFGTGTFSGEETYVSGGKSISDYAYGFDCHNNVAFSKPSLWEFTGHHFANLWRSGALTLQNNGSLLQDKLTLIGCSFGGASYALDYIDNWLDGDTSKNHDSFNHAEWLVTGYGNEPFLFNNDIKTGICLRIKSKTTGASSTVRFGKLSSAYPILIKNNHVNNDKALFINSRDFIDGYIVQDGSAGLSGQAWGCKDLFDGAYAYNAGTNYTSLAKRLGNLSSNAKSLVVIVDGVSSTINFNKDYSSMTNAQILENINAQLSNATADLVVYGRDYYPSLTDMTETVYNNGATYIAKGSVVTKQGGFVKLANANDKVYGVALDDIPVASVLADGSKKGAGRVLKRGYIYADESKAHFVLADNQNPSIGARFAVNNGQLVTDSNGKISVDIDSGIVSINC